MAVFRYEIQKGAENRTFSEDGVRNLSNGTVESDHELNSPYLKLIEDQPAATPTTPVAAATPTSTPQPAAPAANQPVPQAPQTTQTSKEASSN